VIGNKLGEGSGVSSDGHKLSLLGSDKSHEALDSGLSVSGDWSAHLCWWWDDGTLEHLVEVVDWGSWLLGSDVVGNLLDVSGGGGDAVVGGLKDVGLVGEVGLKFHDLVSDNGVSLSEDSELLDHDSDLSWHLDWSWDRNSDGGWGLLDGVEGGAGSWDGSSDDVDLLGDGVDSLHDWGELSSEDWSLGNWCLSHLDDDSLGLGSEGGDLVGKDNNSLDGIDKGGGELLSLDLVLGWVHAGHVSLGKLSDGSVEGLDDGEAVIDNGGCDLGSGEVVALGLLGGSLSSELSDVSLGLAGIDWLELGGSLLLNDVELDSGVSDLSLDGVVLDNNWSESLDSGSEGLGEGGSLGLGDGGESSSDSSDLGSESSDDWSLSSDDGSLGSDGGVENGSLLDLGLGEDGNWLGEDGVDDLMVFDDLSSEWDNLSGDLGDGLSESGDLSGGLSSSWLGLENNKSVSYDSSSDDEWGDLLSDGGDLGSDSLNSGSVDLGV